MAWEERNGRRYYYRKQRVGGQVLSEYVGAGYLGDLAAQLDQIRQEEQATERELWQRLQAEQAALDGEIADYARQVRTITEAALLASGCHRPKRQWRVRRERE